MTCIRMGLSMICMSPDYRLRLSDGGYVFMSWHPYCGPMFYKDKALNREIEDWYENTLICDALGWFIDRGETT